MLSIDRANLPGSGAPRITWNSGEFYTREDVALQLGQDLKEQRSSMYGRVTKTRGGRKIEISLPIFGLWNYISKLFPTWLLNPSVGSRIFGTSDLPFVLWAKNGDKLTVNNVQLVGLANLKLAANVPIFSGNAKFLGLIGNNHAPTDANAYYTFTNATYTEGAFSTSTFKSKAWTGVWGARTGFTNILTQDGWSVDWEVNTTDDLVDGIGPVDQFLELFWARISAIPVGPTFAQIDSNSHYQGDANAAVGSDIAADVDDLALSDGTATVTAKGAALIETGLTWSPNKKRIGATVWEPTRGFTTGAPNAIATVV